MSVGVDIEAQTAQFECMRKLWTPLPDQADGTDAFNSQTLVVLANIAAIISIKPLLFNHTTTQNVRTTRTITMHYKY
ncbi:hypothetical protein GCK32_019146 [Trichostrongylus colubriformis]|uniref:Uncharacterized protein n=1 Tax=Trichostrongylus colubriformis TaxID=6319 RepID=A0AAN8IX22_TRICO